MKQVEKEETAMYVRTHLYVNTSDKYCNMPYFAEL